MSRVRRADVSGMIYHALNRAHCPSRISKRRRIIKGVCRSPAQWGSGNTIRPPAPRKRYLTPFPPRVATGRIAIGQATTTAVARSRASRVALPSGATAGVLAADGVVPQQIDEVGWVVFDVCREVLPLRESHAAPLGVGCFPAPLRRCVCNTGHYGRLAQTP